MNQHVTNSFDYVYENYRQLLGKLDSTRDIHERNIIFRRLLNLLGVMEFLIVAQNVSSHINISG